MPWSLTPSGRAALRQYRDPESSFRAEQAAYRNWTENRSRFAATERILRALPGGSWAAVTDLAEMAGLRADAVVRVLYGTRPEGWHRALDPDGSLPNAAQLNQAERDAWLDRLRDDGFDVAKWRAPASRRADIEDLR